MDQTEINNNIHKKLKELRVKMDGLDEWNEEQISELKDRLDKIAFNPSDLKAWKNKIAGELAATLDSFSSKLEKIDKKAIQRIPSQEIVENLKQYINASISQQNAKLNEYATLILKLGTRVEELSKTIGDAKNLIIAKVESTEIAEKRRLDKAEILELPVWDLEGLTLRTINCLKSENLLYAKDIVKKASWELMTIHGFGVLCLKNLRSVLHAHGLALARTPQPTWGDPLVAQANGSQTNQTAQQ